MIDPILLRTTPEAVRRSERARGNDPAILEQAIAADVSRREALVAFETLRAEQRQLGERVRTATGTAKSQLITEARALATKVKAAETRARAATAEFEARAARIENIVLPLVPSGGEDNFVTLRTVGQPPSFDFTPRDHLELGEMLDAIDMARGAKVSGARFYFLRGVGARLELALMQLALDQALAAGFVPMIPPTLVKPTIMHGTGFLGEHADEVYHLPDTDLFLTGTSEVALAGYHADEIIDVSAAPLRYVGWSTCYRREAGSHGKDTRGILRVHQFNKLEMFVYSDPQEAEDEHERLVAWQEQLLRSLGISYRVIDVAAGDLGASAARKFDIEAWIPTQNTFRELTSTSNCTTYQARRLAIRTRQADGSTEAVATLNGTLATTRWLVAILETHQQSDGSVQVPEPLRPYLGGRDTLTPTAPAL